MTSKDQVIDALMADSDYGPRRGAFEEAYAAGVAAERERHSAKASDLYERLSYLSKVLEGSGVIDEHEHPSAYATILDAMNMALGQSQA